MYLFKNRNAVRRALPEMVSCQPPSSIVFAPIEKSFGVCLFHYHHERQDSLFCAVMSKIGYFRILETLYLWPFCGASQAPFQSLSAMFLVINRRYYKFTFCCHYVGRTISLEVHLKAISTRRYKQYLDVPVVSPLSDSQRLTPPNYRWIICWYFKIF